MIKTPVVSTLFFVSISIYSNTALANEIDVKSSTENLPEQKSDNYLPKAIPKRKLDHVHTDELEVITVTANKRKQSVQEIPLTVNVLNAQDIIELGIRDMENILTQFPNLSSNATTELAVGYSIRGIGTNNPHGNISQAVGVYRDEGSYGSPYSGILGVYDTERIEVLRGPQNTLFGRNAIGGAVHFISAKPSIGDDHATGFIYADVGRFNQFDVTGAINMPLSDTVALRLAGQSVQRDGIYNNLATDHEGNPLGESTLGDKDRQSGRLQLSWQPSPETELLVNYHYANHDGTNIGNRAFGIRDENDPFLLINGAQDFIDDSVPDDRASISTFIEQIDANKPTVVNAVDRNGFNPATGDWHKIYNVSSARSAANVSGGFFKVSHQFESDYSVYWRSSFDDTELETSDETSGTNSLQFIPNREGLYEQQAHEFRLISPDNQSIRWLAGLYYFKEDMDLYTVVRRFNYIGLLGNVPRDVAAHNILEQEDSDISLYGNIEWDISQRFTLSTGLRYTDNSKTAASRFGVAANYNTNPSGGGSISSMPFDTASDLIFDRVPTDTFLGKNFLKGCYADSFTECDVLSPTIKEYSLEQDLGEWSGRVALDYQHTDNQLYYVSYAHGFKSGGFDTRALAAFFGEGAEQAFLPEFLDTYEFGFKTQMSKSLQINSAIFYNIWKDLQTFGVFNGEPRYVNIPKSTSKGIESEIKWIPRESWFTQLGIGLLDSEITDNGTLTAADEGHELSNAPWLTLNALLKKDIVIASGLLTLQTDARYVSEQIDGLTYESDRFATKAAQFWLNARVNYQFGHEQQYNIALWVDNLTEETHCVDIGMQNIIPPGTAEADIGPRGIDLTSTITCQPSATSGERFFGVSVGVKFY